MVGIKKLILTAIDKKADAYSATGVCPRVALFCKEKSLGNCFKYEQ